MFAHVEDHLKTPSASKFLLRIRPSESDLQGSLKSVQHDTACETKTCVASDWTLSSNGRCKMTYWEGLNLVDEGNVFELLKLPKANRIQL